MQDIEKTINAGPGRTINVMGKGWHSGAKAYLDPFEWAALQGFRFKIYPGLHRGPRKTVNGFRLYAGRDYIMTIATAHRMADLFLWAGQAGYPIDVIAANTPGLKLTSTRPDMHATA